MSDIDSALHDIQRLRHQLAASSRFQGLAPGVVALTGGLALALGLWQQVSGRADLAAWILLAAICAMLIGIEAVVRARKAHRSMADRMLGSTLNRFLPVAAAGGIAGIVVLLRAPEHARLLPGLWQLLMGVGIFAVLGSLPRRMALAGGFYFLTGTLALALSGANGPATGWLMAGPFAAGQLLVAAILHHASQETEHG